MSKSIFDNKKLISWDLDGTILESSSIKEMIRLNGRLNDYKDLHHRAWEAREISYKQYATEKAKLIKGLSVRVADEVVREMKLSKGAKEVIARLRDRGCLQGIISMGYKISVDYWSRYLGFDFAISNDIEQANGIYLGKLLTLSHYETDEMPLDKGLALSSITERYGLHPQQIVAIGNGFADRGMFRVSGLSIGYKTGEFTNKYVDYRVEDLCEILNI